MALLRPVLDSAAEGSEPLKEAFGPMKARLNAADVDLNVPWMDPETANLERGEQRAAQAVDRLRRLLPQATEVDGLRARTERGILQIYPTVGWLVQDANGWRVRTGGTVPREGELWVVLPVDRAE